jgi:hypothetical protein
VHKFLTTEFADMRLSQRWQEPPNGFVRRPKKNVKAYPAKRDILFSGSDFSGILFSHAARTRRGPSRNSLKGKVTVVLEIIVAGLAV